MKAKRAWLGLAILSRKMCTHGLAFGNHIIYSDNHLLVYNKPPGVLSQKDRTNDADVKELCLAWLQENRNTKYANVVHRLDRPCSGAIMVALSSKGASRLSKSLANGKVHKTYCVIVKDCFQHIPHQGWLIDALVQAPESATKAKRTICHNLAILAHEPSSDEWSHFQESPLLKSHKAQLAILRYDIIAKSQGLALLGIQLTKTGRRHQIRAQLASLGAPVLGDTKYGPTSSTSKFSSCIALHCLSLEAPHPILHRPPIDVVAPIPHAAWGGTKSTKANRHSLNVPTPLLEAADSLFRKSQKEADNRRRHFVAAVEAPL